MAEKQKMKISDKLKIGFLLAYFLILTVERVISLVSVFLGDFSAYDALDWYMTALTLFALFGAYVYLITRCELFTKSYNGEGASTIVSPKNFGRLSIAAGILLLGGMVHTDGTIPGIQFTSYGMILVSMAVHTAVQVRENGGGLKRWLSFAYIVAFSMSIPVVYHSYIELSWLFIPLECVVSAGMVILFTIMLKHFYEGDGEYSFSIVPFLVMTIGDAAVIYLRWDEEINFFVLIFASLAAVLWIVGKLLRAAKKQ
ncbi:MAG: hypothetical protein J1F03_08965 [Oscillospiraceae bacterium]|nr:hypothetical protein [Oscillospiraceae bacterium]